MVLGRKKIKDPRTACPFCLSLFPQLSVCEVVKFFLYQKIKVTYKVYWLRCYGTKWLSLEIISCLATYHRWSPYTGHVIMQEKKKCIREGWRLQAWEISGSLLRLLPWIQRGKDLHLFHIVNAWSAQSSTTNPGNGPQIFLTRVLRPSIASSLWWYC